MVAQCKTALTYPVMGGGPIRDGFSHDPSQLESSLVLGSKLSLPLTLESPRGAFPEGAATLLNTNMSKASKTAAAPATSAPAIAGEGTIETAVHPDTTRLARYAAFERLSDSQLESLAKLAKLALSTKSQLGQLDRSSLPHGSIGLTARGAVIRHEVSKSKSERTESEKKAAEVIGTARKILAALGDNPFLSPTDLVKFTTAG